MYSPQVIYIIIKYIYVIYKLWLGGIYDRYTTYCGGGLCGCNPRPVELRGIST